MEQKRPRKVFVFGAGASHKCRPYRVNGFAAQQKVTQVPLLGDILKQAKSKHYVHFSDVEDALTYFEIAKDRAKSEEERGFARHRISELKDLLVQALKVSCYGVRSESYQRFCDNILTKDDSVITFNWDDLLDKALRRTEERLVSSSGQEYQSHLGRAIRLTHIDAFGAGISLKGVRHVRSYSTAGEGLYLKLHGSVNWFYCDYELCPERRSAWLDYEYDTERYWFKPPDCPMCGRRMSTMIVPPSFRKSYKFPALDYAWQLAADRMKEANEVVFIGYSFPESDFYSHWLFKPPFLKRSQANVQPTLTVVNPDPTVAVRIKRLVGAAFCDTYRSFSQYLKAQLPSSEQPESEVTTAAHFEKEIESRFRHAEQYKRSYIDLNAGDIHRSIGGYPNRRKHRMPLCCTVMRRLVQPGDRVLWAPPKGKGASLTIRYRFPRKSRTS